MADAFGKDGWEIKTEQWDREYPRLFYVNKIKEVENVIADYELKTMSQFSIVRETKHFADNWSIYEAFPSHRLFWQDRDGRYEKIPSDGIPFLVVGKRTLSCTFGPTYRDTDKAKKRSIIPRSSDCPAQISIREIHKFPTHQLKDMKLLDSKHSRSKHMGNLRDRILKKEVEGERRFYVSLPRMSDHQGHDFDKDLVKMRTDCRVSAKLTDLVYQRIFDQAELNERITKYVQEELFKGQTPPPPTDSRFYPTSRRIRNICYNTRIKMQEEGITVPFEHRGAKTRNEGDKNETGPKWKRKKRMKVRVEPENKLVTSESTDAAKMLLMLEKEARSQQPDSPGAAPLGDNPSVSSGDESPSARLITHTDPSPAGTVAHPDRHFETITVQESVGDDDGIQVVSQDVIDLHPDRHACLDLVEQLKPLIMLSEDLNKIGALRNVLANCVNDLEGKYDDIGHG